MRLVRHRGLLQVNKEVSVTSDMFTFKTKSSAVSIANVRETKNFFCLSGFVCLILMISAMAEMQRATSFVLSLYVFPSTKATSI